MKCGALTGFGFRSDRRELCLVPLVVGLGVARQRRTSVKGFYKKPAAKAAYERRRCLVAVYLNQ